MNHQRTGFLLAFVCFGMTFHAVARSSSSYAITAETLDGGGRQATSANYTSQASIETTVIATSSGTAVSLGHGYFSSLIDSLVEAYTQWISQFYPNVFDENIIGPAADPNNDGWVNGLAFILASSPIDYLPFTLPIQTRDDTYLIVEFARSDNATAMNPGIEYSIDMVEWILAIDGQGGVLIEIEDDGFGTDAFGDGIDKITVKIPHNGIDKMFFQLVAGE